MKGSVAADQPRFCANVSTMWTCSPTPNSLDFCMFIFRPETDSKHFTISIKKLALWSDHSLLKIASSANWRCEIWIYDSPMRTGWKMPLETDSSIIICKASIVRMKRKGERGSPCRSSLSMLNSPVGLPLTRTDTLVELRHLAIQRLHFSPKFIWWSTDWRKVCVDRWRIHKISIWFESAEYV